MKKKKKKNMRPEEVSRGDAEGNGRTPQTSSANPSSQGEEESQELDFLREIVKSAKEHKRVTETLLDKLWAVDEFVTTVCEMAQFYPRIEIERQYYRVMTRRSKIGSDTALELAEELGAWRRLPSALDQIGGGYWLHGDFHAHIRCASREQILKMAEDVPKLLKVLCARIRKEVAKESELVEKLERIQRCIEGIESEWKAR